MKYLYLNSALFFIISNGKIYAWDYLNHNQFEIEEPYFKRLLEISEGVSVEPAALDKELLESQLLSTEVSTLHWGWDDLSKIFHHGTKIKSEQSHADPEAFIKDYYVSCENLDEMPTDSEVDILLPKPQNFLTMEHSLYESLNERKTSRVFDEKQLDFQRFNELLFLAGAYLEDDFDEYKKIGLARIGRRRTSPSAGGLQSTEIYIVANNIENVDRGLYYYNPSVHGLKKISDLPENKDFLAPLLCGQYFSENAALGVFFTLRLDQAWKKYPHSRAYRAALLDVGHLSQTFQLIGTALSVNTWLTGIFDDYAVEKFLKIKNVSEQPIFFNAFGFGKKTSIDIITSEKLSQRSYEA